MKYLRGHTYACCLHVWTGCFVAYAVFLSQCVVEVSATPACNITRHSNNQSNTNITSADSAAFKELQIPARVTTGADALYYSKEAELCSDELSFEPGTPGFQACVVCLNGLLRCVESGSQQMPFYFAVAAVALLLLPCFYCCFWAEENTEFRLGFEGGEISNIN